MTEAMEYEDEQLIEEQLVEEPLEGEEDDFEDIDEEGDIAADYLEELLDIVDMDGDIDIEVRNNRIYLSVVNDDDDNEELRHLVGRHGRGSGRPCRNWCASPSWLVTAPVPA